MVKRASLPHVIHIHLLHETSFPFPFSLSPFPFPLSPPPLLFALMETVLNRQSTCGVTVSQTLPDLATTAGHRAGLVLLPLHRAG